LDFANVVYIAIFSFDFQFRMYEEAMTTMQLDPPPFSRVSLALPAPPAGSSATAEDVNKKPTVERRPSRFEVVKAPEMLNSVDDQPQDQRSPGSDPMTPSSVQSGENEDVCEQFLYIFITANSIMMMMIIIFAYTESLFG
jgi:hypothetical protein